MSDVVVTVPKKFWQEWVAEGDEALVHEPAPWGEINEYGFTIGARTKPDIYPGQRVYIVAHGALRGYAPLVRIDSGRSFGGKPGSIALVRRGGAVAVTLRSDTAAPLDVPGFQGWRYRWWEPADEVPFPEWKTWGVT